MTLFVPDALPKILIELRDDNDVVDIVADRVRAPEPAPGDGKGPGHYVAFVVVRQLDAPRIGRLPVQRPRILVRSYGRTHQEAAALRWACSNALHLIGPRTFANGLGIYLSRDDTGGEQETDPDTKQPYQDFIVDLWATTQSISAS